MTHKNSLWLMNVTNQDRQYVVMLSEAKHLRPARQMLSEAKHDNTGFGRENL